MKHSISVIVPAYNEEPSLRAAVSAIRHDLTEAELEYEIVVVNDGSIDKTGEIAEQLAHEHVDVQVVHHPENEGLGAGIKTGIAHATCELVIVCPVDSPLDAHQIKSFLQAINHADIVVGYRSNRPGYKWWMSFASKVYYLMIRTLFGLRLRDYNWIHLYRKRVFDKVQITCKGIVYLPEVLVKAADLGYSIVEIPMEMKPRAHGKATVSKPRVIVKTFFDLLGLWRMTRLPWRVVQTKLSPVVEQGANGKSERSS
jgi:glycosyltransferase involved in cell wall biosynthesis